MAKWVNAEVLKQGLNYLSTNCNEIRLISAYSAGDSYATVNTNTLAKTTRTSSDLPVSASGNNQRIVTTTATAPATAPASGTPDLHIAFINYNAGTPANSVVLWVTDESSNPAAIAVDDTINFGSVILTAAQPT